MTVQQQKRPQKTKLMQQSQAEESKTSDDQKIAENESKEYATVKIENLEIMAEDLGQMEWDEVNQKCAELGNGWRLPTKEELNFLYKTKKLLEDLTITNIGALSKRVPKTMLGCNFSAMDTNTPMMKPKYPMLGLFGIYNRSLAMSID